MSNKGIIDINAIASPAVLAGLFGISASGISQGRKEGKLPPHNTATYRECITHYCNYWKLKSASKVSGVAEADLLQKIKLNAAKTEAEWLNIKQKKMELLDVQELAEIFEPVFLHIRTLLVSLSRKYPNMQKDIDLGLAELYELGMRLQEKANTELDGYIASKMEEEVDVGDSSEIEGIEDLPINSFDDYEEPTYISSRSDFE